MILRILKKEAKASFLLGSWWVVLFLLLCLGFFEHTQIKGRAFYRELKGRLEALHEEKTQADAINEELKMKIKSQDDPAYIQLTLMRVLGVKKQNQIKVYFIPSSN